MDNRLTGDARVEVRNVSAMKTRRLGKCIAFDYKKLKGCTRGNNRHILYIVMEIDCSICVVLRSLAYLTSRSICAYAGLERTGEEGASPLGSKYPNQMRIYIISTYQYFIALHARFVEVVIGSDGLKVVLVQFRWWTKSSTHNGEVRPTLKACC